MSKPNSRTNQKMTNDKFWQFRNLAGDDQKAEILSEPDIDGNHAFLVQQGMAAFFDVDVAFFIEDRLGSVVGFAEHGPGKNEIQLDHNVKVCANGVHILGCLFT